MKKLGPYELNSIIVGDAQELAEAIPNESVDLILADPVYDRIEDYEWLAKTAARILKPNSSLIVQVAHYYLPDVLRVTTNHIDYYWIISQRLGRNSRMWSKKIFANWKPYLWFMSKKNKSIRGGGWTMDSIYSPPDKNTHKWGDGIESFLRLIQDITSENNIVFDPFVGGGTVPAACKMLNRQYLAFEIDLETAELARQRIINTQPPLPIVYPEQIEMIVK